MRAKTILVAARRAARDALALSRQQQARSAHHSGSRRPHCPHCTTAYEELAALRDAPRTAPAEGLLPWGGTAYAAGGPDERAAGGTGVWRSGSGPAGSGRESEDGERAPDRRRTVLVSAVLGAALCRWRCSWRRRADLRPLTRWARRTLR
ncbi:hypothetical protein GCM10010285_60690 [Streptomyces pseudogriseolus]|uniref:Uncharacterized protein n=1 Tax=Streptomyces pseudogriseolus TaxID=36817 RepID=A0ABQ2TMP5_STREZ|nr:hypothetical protein GCM10010285_60690 [Streptomyces rubiginosus]